MSEQPDFDNIKVLLKNTPLGGLPLDPAALLVPKTEATWHAVNFLDYDLENIDVPLDNLDELAERYLAQVPTFSWCFNGDSDEASEAELPNFARLILDKLPDPEPIPQQENEDCGVSVTSELSPDLRPAAPREIVTVASNLYQIKVKRFLSEKTISRLIDLNRSLNSVNPEAIDLADAEIIVEQAMKFLNGDLTMCLAACETLLHYRLKRPDALHLNSIKNINAAILAFKEVVIEIPQTLEAFVGVEWVMCFWVKLIEDKSISDQQSLPLLLAAYSVIFSPSFQSRTVAAKKYDGVNILEQARRKCADLVVACYSAFPEMRKEIIHDICNNLSKLGKWRRGFAISFAPGSGSIHVVVGLILRVIQKSGQTPMELWHRAAETRNKQALEKACQAANKEATQYCVLLSQFLIEACHTSSKASPIRVLTQCLVEDMAAALPFAEWPASQLFISCFISLLFHASPLYMKQRSFMVFLLDILKTVQSALYHVYKSQPDVSVVGTVVDQLVRMQKLSTANFLASTLCARPSKSVSYLEFYARLTTESPPYIGYRRVPQSLWFKILRTWQIGNYYEQIMEVMLAITYEGNVADKSQVEILKLMAQCVETNSSFFERIEEKLIFCIQNGPPSVCDGAMLVIIRYISVTSIDGNINLIEKAISRLTSPGLAAYKKRCSKFLFEVFLQTDSNELKILAWKALLRASGDGEATVSKLGLELLQDLVFNQSAEGSKQLQLLSNMFLETHTSEAPYPWLLKRFLRLTLVTLPFEKSKRENIRNLVGYLLDSIGEGSKPNFSSLKAASVILEANGFYVPTSKIASLFSLACSSREGPQHRLIALRMLNAALSATPRIIISPRVIAHYFPLLLSKMQIFSEPEVEYSGPILWELCQYGNMTDRKTRLLSLKNLTKNAFSHYAKQKDLKSAETSVVVSQLLLLMTAAVRFWVGPEHPHPLKDQLIDILIKLIKTDNSRLRLASVVCLIKTCTRYPEMFLEPRVAGILSTEVLVKPSSEEWNIFILLLLEFLQNEEDKLEVKAQTAPKEMGDSLLHSNSSEATQDSVAAGLLQKYLEPILRRTLASEDAFAAVSVRLLTQAIESGRVEAHECIPAVVALTTAQSLEISKTALRAFTFMISRWRSVVEQKLPEGLQLAIEYHEQCGTGPVSPKLVASLWEILRTQATSLKTMIQCLLKSFKHCTPAYATVVINSLTIARIDQRDVSAIIKSIEDICYSCDLLDTEYTSESIAIFIALYGLRLVLLANSGDTGDELHKLDAGRVISRYETDFEGGREVYEQLLDIDHFNAETQVLLYGSKKRRT